MATPVKVTPVYEALEAAWGKLVEGSSIPTIVEVGGAGSSKSHSVAQFILRLWGSYTGLRIAVGRKTFPSQRTSAMALLVELMQKYGKYREKNHSKTENTYRERGNYMLFFSLGEGESGREKIKSFDCNLIWIEEATEFDWEDYAQLKLRVRHPAPEGFKNCLILSHNPIDENHWIKTKLIDGKMENVVVLHSTFEDNPFVDEGYRQTLRKLINEDENYYRIYTLGEWGRLENIIYKNWEIVDRLPEKWQAWGYGLDWGFVHPTAVVKVVLTEDRTYWHEMLYATKLTNADVIERLGHMDRGPVWADPARADAIEELRRAGVEVMETNKEVKTGLDVCKRRRIGITRESVNVVKEIRGYAYKKDHNGVVHEEPVKFNDDAMDAARYATLGLVERYGYATVGRRPKSWPLYGKAVKSTYLEQILGKM